MTLREIKEMADDMVNQYGEKALNLDVYASCDYGDYTHTQQLISLDDPLVIKPYKTAYSQTGLAVRDEGDEDMDDGDDDDDDDDELKGKVIVL